MVTAHGPLERREVRPALADGDGREPRLVQAEGLDRAEVAGRLDRDGVAGVDEALRDEVEALLRAVHDLDVRGGHVEADAAPVAVGDELAERAVPVGGRVLQGCRTRVGEHVGRGLRDPGRVEDRRRRQAPRERDHGRVGRDGEERAEERRRDCGHAAGEAVRARCHGDPLGAAGVNPADREPAPRTRRSTSRSGTTGRAGSAEIGPVIPETVCRNTNCLYGLRSILDR